MTFNIVQRLNPETLQKLLTWNDSNGFYDEANLSEPIDQAYLIYNAIDQELDDHFLTTDPRVQFIYATSIDK